MLAQPRCYFFERLFSLCFRVYRIWIRLATRVSSRRPISPAKFVLIDRLDIFRFFLGTFFYCFAVGLLEFESVKMLVGFTPGGSFLQDDRDCAMIPARFPECFRPIIITRSTSCETIFNLQLKRLKSNKNSNKI